MSNTRRIGTGHGSRVLMSDASMICSDDGAYWIQIPINPEPWAVSVTTRGGTYKPAKLQAYQSAIAADVKKLLPAAPLWTHADHPVGGIVMEFFFWRSTKYGQFCDITNLIKSTEDAMQGVLFDNDRLVHRVIGEIVEQGQHVTQPRVLIRATDHPETGLRLTVDVFKMLLQAHTPIEYKIVRDNYQDVELDF